MLAELIPKVAEMTNEEEHPFYPRPSSAGPERCIRQMVYHGLNTPRKPLPGRAIIIFSDSSFHEDLTADWIRKTAFRLHSEQMKVSCRPPMKEGSIDGIVTDMLGVDTLLEHKALNHFTFQRYWNGELLLDYLTQTAIYTDAIQREINPELNEAILLIKNKNTAQYLEFLCRYNSIADELIILEKTHSNGESEKLDITIDKPVTKACEKFNQVLDYIEKQTLPKRQYEIDSWRCEYCGWGTTCWQGYEKEYAELKTDAMLPNEVADLVHYYKESGAHINEMKKEYEGLKTNIKDFMKEAEAREGRAGKYLVKLKLKETASIDKSLLTEQERERVTKKGFKERMSISKIKGV